MLQNHTKTFTLNSHFFLMEDNVPQVGSFSIHTGLPSFLQNYCKPSTSWIEELQQSHVHTLLQFSYVLGLGNKPAVGRA